MTVHIHRVSVAVFVVGMLSLIAGAFAVGLSLARPAEAATGYKLIHLQYLTNITSNTACGGIPGGIGSNEVKRINWSNGDNLMLCDAYIRAVK